MALELHLVQGVAMLSSVLNSKQAIDVNIEITRTFVSMRPIMTEHAALARELQSLERKYDAQFKIVFDAIRDLMTQPTKSQRRIGFCLEYASSRVSASQQSLHSVPRVLTRLTSMHGVPIHLRSNNGPEFISRALLQWKTKQGIACAFNGPGKPWQSGTNESFNGRFRDECLSVEWFRNRTEAKCMFETWRRHYNERRPHSSLGGMTPKEFKRKYTESDR